MRAIDSGAPRSLLNDRLELIHYVLPDFFSAGSIPQSARTLVKIVSAIEGEFKSDPIELSPIHVERVPPSENLPLFITRGQDLVERYAMNRKEVRRASIRKYRALRESLSLASGPWSTPEHVPSVHLKLEDSIFRYLLRIRMKPNSHFQDHRDASLLRDLGSVHQATAVYQTELAQRRSAEFKPDFALTHLEETDDAHSLRMELPESVAQKCPAELITIKGLFEGTLFFAGDEVFFESEKLTLLVPLSKVRAVYLRNWQHLDMAMEIFMTHPKAYFLTFPQGDRKHFLRWLLAQKLPSLKYFQKHTSDAKALAQKATRKWLAGGLSNFDYLMKLNLFAGRSCNALGQYPVLPWVLKDYTSKQLSLDDPAVFRDLGCSIAGMDSGRLASLESDGAGPPTFGSLYSSAAAVLGFLIRVEPFTSLHVAFQSGRFDHPDRLFDSISDTWSSVCTTGSDYRELIPEFFTFPEFLTNSNGFDLGVRENGRRVADVLLPPWAKSPREFVERNRAALESKFVTVNLHRWIDLIFGPSSRLPLSIGANNNFNPYFYESALTPEVRRDPGTLGIIREFAQCFGVVPMQLFDERPPGREIGLPGLGRSLLARIEIPGMFTTLIPDGQWLAGVYSDRAAFAFFKGGVQIVKGRLEFPYPDLPGISPIIALSTKYAAACFPTSPSFHAFAFRDGHFDLLGISRGHSRPITALAVYEDYIVSASEDCTLCLWHCTGGKPHERIPCPHSRPIAFVRMRAVFHEIVAVSRNGFVSVSSLSLKRPLRGVQLPFTNPTEMIVSRRGFIAAAFNGHGSVSVVVLGANLDQTAVETVDGCLICWAAPYVDGMDYLAMAVTPRRLVVLRLPTLERVGDDMEMGFTPRAMAFVKNDRMLYIATAEKGVIGIPIGSIIAE
jgi:hypothetical protein